MRGWGRWQARLKVIVELASIVEKGVEKLLVMYIQILWDLLSH